MFSPDKAQNNTGYRGLLVYVRALPVIVGLSTICPATSRFTVYTLFSPVIGAAAKLTTHTHTHTTIKWQPTKVIFLTRYNPVRDFIQRRRNVKNIFRAWCTLPLPRQKVNYQLRLIINSDKLYEITSLIWLLQQGTQALTCCHTPFIGFWNIFYR